MEIKLGNQQLTQEAALRKRKHQFIVKIKELNDQKRMKSLSYEQLYELKLKCETLNLEEDEAIIYQLLNKLTTIKQESLEKDFQTVKDQQEYKIKYLTLIHIVLGTLLFSIYVCSQFKSSFSQNENRYLGLATLIVAGLSIITTILYVCDCCSFGGRRVKSKVRRYKRPLKQPLEQNQHSQEQQEPKKQNKVKSSKKKNNK